MRRRPWPTRVRLTLIAVGALLTVLAVSDLVTLRLADSVVSLQALAELNTEVDLIAGGLNWDGSQATLGGQPLPATTIDGTPLEVDLVGPASLLFATRQPSLSAAQMRDLAAQARHQGPDETIVVDNRGRRRRVAWKALDPDVAGAGAVVLVHGVLPTGVYDGPSWLPPALAIVSLVVVLVGGGATYWTAGRVLRPVSEIAATARALSERDLHRRVETPVPGDELGQLVATLNGMLDRLERSFASLRSFTADASHELRAPLALMQAEVEVALGQERPAADCEPVLRSLQDGIAHLARLSDHLLLLARADARTLAPVPQRIWLPEFLDEAADRWQAAASRAGVELVVEAPAEAELTADRMLLRRVIDNLLDNAVRYTPPGGRVHLRGVVTPDGRRIEVEDDGPGIATEDRTRLFTRFARLEGARTPRTGGAGLGLAICAAIAEAHGGRITVVDGCKAGARFVLELPTRRHPRGRARSPARRAGSQMPRR